MQLPGFVAEYSLPPSRQAQLPPGRRPWLRRGFTLNHKRTSRTKLRCLVVGFAVSLMLVGGVMTASSGSAAAQEVLVPASSCLTGDSGPRGLVVATNGPTFFSNLYLYCGDPTKGIIHINAEHPIKEDGSDDENVANCARNIMHRGSEIPAAQGNRAYRITRAEGGSATLVWDENSNEVIMFTSDNNNWAACAAFGG